MFEPAQRPGTEPFRWRERELVLTDDRVPEATVAQPAYAYPGGPAILPRRPVRLTGGLGDFESVRRPTGRSAEATTARPAAASGFAVERLHGKPAIRARIRELMATARHEAVLCLPDGPGAEGGPEGARLGDAGLASRSVTVRTLCSERVRGDSDILRRVRTLAEHGVAVRAVSSLSARLHLVDRRTAVVQLGDDQEHEALVVTQPALIAVLSSLFEAVWATAVPLTAGTAAGDAAITPPELALLQLLGEGLTDDAAARKLGVSLRTERRMLTRVSQHLDAQSRFQLGQRAVQRGIL